MLGAQALVEWLEKPAPPVVQPDEGVKLTMMIKDPGPGGMRLGDGRGNGLDHGVSGGVGHHQARS